MHSYRLTLEYDGTRYRGWQQQRNTERTVAGVLVRALAEVGVEVGELAAAGRTDAGVHALAQVAHLKTAVRFEPAWLAAATNARLPHDVNLLAVAPAPARFHARHDAAARSYLYQLALRRTALAKRYVWWVGDRLDVDTMAGAAARLVGRHDFARFCERPAEQTSTLVHLERAEVVEAGGLVLVRLVASHFLWRMVRRVVGALVEVGAGRLDPAALTTRLAPAAEPRDSLLPARWTAPPSGLFLERVLYPGEPPLGPLRPATPLTN
jgi:tRNA pseudouridine38-40 synthase